MLFCRHRSICFHGIKGSSQRQSDILTDWCCEYCLHVVCSFPQGGNQGLTVVIQGQGQTTGQLQLIPQGVTILPGPGQQLMQAAMPNGTVQRFLFTPLATAATAATTTTTTVSTTAAGRTWGHQKCCMLLLKWDGRPTAYLWEDMPQASELTRWLVSLTGSLVPAGPLPPLSPYKKYRKLGRGAKNSGYHGNCAHTCFLTGLGGTDWVMQIISGQVGLSSS